MSPSRGNDWSSASYSSGSNSDYSRYANYRRYEREPPREPPHDHYYDDRQYGYPSSRGRRSPVYEEYPRHEHSFENSHYGDRSRYYDRESSHYGNEGTNYGYGYSDGQIYGQGEPSLQFRDDRPRDHCGPSNGPCEGYREPRRSRSPPRREPIPRNDPAPSYTPTRSAARSPTPPPPRPTSPTPEYNATAAETSHPVTDPTQSRKLLILDLNGTLLLRGDRRRLARPQHYSHPPGYTHSDVPPRPVRAVYTRPFLGTFKDYLFHPSNKEWLDIMVWSSAQPHSVADMVDRCFRDRTPELKAVWARDTLGLTTSEYNAKTQTRKNLEKPWADLPSQSQHSAKTTLLMDDSPLKAILQPWNHLCIGEYSAETRKRDLVARHAEIAEEAKEKLEIARKSLMERRAAREAQIGSGTDLAEQTRTSRADEKGEEVEEGREEGVEEAPTASPEVTRVEVRKKKKETKKQIKQEKKEREKALKAESSGLEGDAALVSEGVQYDETLLAVIGVLDTLKHQDNVSGWMKHGGLMSVVEDSQSFDPEESLPGNLTHEKISRHRESDSPSATSQSPLKKRKMNDEAEDVASESPAELRASSPDVPPPSSSPPRSEANLDVVREEQAQTGVPLMSDNISPVSSPPPQSLWFENPDVLLHWAERGRQACQSLEIEVRSDVVVSDPGEA